MKFLFETWVRPVGGRTLMVQNDGG